LKHVNLQDYLNHKDISHIGSVVCDSAIVDDEGNLRVQEEVIKRASCLSRSTPSSSFFRTTLYATIFHTMWPNQTKMYGMSCGARFWVVVEVSGYVVRKIRFINGRCPG
jgi:hypothetical protein